MSIVSICEQETDRAELCQGSASALAIVMFMSFRAWATGPYQTTTCNLPVSLFLLLNGIVFTLFVLWIMVFYRPNELQYGIEKNRIRWIAVIKSYTNGCLKRILDEEGCPAKYCTGAENETPAKE